MPVNSFGDPIEAPHGGAGPQVLNSFGDPVELPGPPKAPIPQGLAEPFSQQYGLTAAQRADVRSRDTRGLEEIGGATLIPAASGAVRAAAAGEPILPAVVQSAKNLGTSMVSGGVAALGARKAAKYLGAPEGVADAAAIIGGLYGAKAGGSVSEYLSAEKGIPSTWKFLKWLRNRPATTVPDAEEPETEAGPAPAVDTLADGSTVQDIGRGLGVKSWKNATADQKAGAQSIFDKLKAAETVAPTSAAGAPPPSPTPSSGPAAQPASAAPTVLRPNGGPLRPPLAPQPSTAAPSVVSAPPAEAPPSEALRTANRTFVKDARPSAEDYTLMEVPTAKLDAGWSKEGPAFYIPPGGGGAEIGGRLARAQEFIQSGTPVEAPRVSMAENGRIAFEDGRHRFAAMRDAGDPTVGVMVPHEQVADFQNLSKPAPAPATEAPSVRNGVHQANIEAKAQRFVDAVQQMYRDHPATAGSNVTFTPGTLRQALVTGGYIRNTEVFPDASWPLIQQGIAGLKAARQTIRPPKGFSMGQMGTKF